MIKEIAKSSETNHQNGNGHIDQEGIEGLPTLITNGNISIVRDDYGNELHFDKNGRFLRVKFVDPDGGKIVKYSGEDLMFLPQKIEIRFSPHCLPK